VEQGEGKASAYRGQCASHMGVKEEVDLRVRGGGGEKSNTRKTTIHSCGKIGMKVPITGKPEWSREKGRGSRFRLEGGNRHASN